MRAATLVRPRTAPVAATAWWRTLADYWPLAPVLLGITLLALPTLSYPFGPDQSIFATIGAAINRGEFPYVDAWDQKPPAIYLLYALALRLPGPLMARVRVLDLAWTLATITALYHLARGWWGVRAATFAALLYGAVYFTTQGWWYLAQPDGFIGLPLLLAVAAYLRSGRGDRSWPWLVAAGLSVGVAFQLRFIAAPMLPAFALVVPARRRGQLSFIGEMVWVGAGFVAVQCALLAYLAAGHALRAYLEATQFAAGYTGLGWPYAPEHRTVIGYLNYARSALLFYATAHLALVFVGIIGMFAAWTLAPNRHARALALMVVAGYLGIAAQQKFFWYHWQLLLPFLALLAGWMWDGLWGLIETRLGRGWQGLAGKAALVAVVLVASPQILDYGYAQWDDFLHRDDSRLMRTRYDNQFGGYGEGTFSYLADVQVAEYLRGHTASDDSVYVFGYDPLVYLLSDRRSASRLIYSLPLMSKWAPPRWQNEFLSDLERNRPLYFIVQRNEGAARWITGQTEDTAAWAWKIHGIAARLEREYDEEIEIEDFTLYRRRTP